MENNIVNNPKTMNRIFSLCIIISTILCGSFYGLFFNKMSESEMMFAAYFWVFLLATGITGLAFKKHKKRSVIALVYGFIALFLLMFFYAQIWPML